jgi:hypothetical protein
MRQRPDRRPFGPGPYVLAARIAPGYEPLADPYPFLPAVHALSCFAPIPR